MSREIFGVPNAILGTNQERRLFTANFASNTTSRTYSPDFPRSLYSKLMLRLSGTLSKTEACAGTLAGEGPLNLIRGVRIIADGEIIKEISATHLRVLSHHIYRGLDTNLTNVTLGTDAAEAFSARLELDFQVPRSKTPELGYFPAHRYDQISFEVDWGGFTELVAGGAYTGVSFPTNPTLEVFGEEILDPKMRSARFLIHKYAQKIFSVSSSAQTAAQFQLPVGEVYRGILISQYTRTPDTPLATLVTATGNIVIRANGAFRKLETNWTELRQRNQARYGIAMPTGYAFVDFMEDGDFGRAFRADSGGVTAFDALVDTASVASAFLQFTPVTLKPAR